MTIPAILYTLLWLRQMYRLDELTAVGVVVVGVPVVLCEILVWSSIAT